MLAGFPPVLRDAGRIGAVTLVSALLVANATAAVLDNVVRPSRERYYRPGGDEAYVNVLPWVTAHTPPDAVFLWAKASLRYPWSGRKSATIRPTGDPDAMLRSILESKIDYAVIDSFSKGARRYLQPVVEKHPEHFRLVHQNDVSAVYQVIRTP